jgi:V/A-type H+-transporting ATPase subunit D
MSQVRLTKNELRNQQLKHQQLSRYLPTLQLKKAMLQQEVNGVGQQLDEANLKFSNLKDSLLPVAELFRKSGMSQFFTALEPEEVFTTVENIAGVDIPLFSHMTFKPLNYDGVSTPAWWDYAILQLKQLLVEKEKLKYIALKKKILEKELREVSIRVNLFEKVLIPRTIANIKKIKIFLGDLQLSAVSQAKVAKSKIEAKRKLKSEVL